jgi:hypothetical protein
MHSAQLVFPLCPLCLCVEIFSFSALFVPTPQMWTGTTLTPAPLPAGEGRKATTRLPSTASVETASPADTDKNPLTSPREYSLAALAKTAP